MRSCGRNDSNILDKSGKQEKNKYHNDPKFLDRQVSANSADPDQTAPLNRVYTVCHTVCIFLSHYSLVEPHCSNNYSNFLGVSIFMSFTVSLAHLCLVDYLC